MLGQKSQRKKKVATNRTTNVSLESSLTSMDWLPTMKIGENPLPTSTTSTKEALLNPSPLPSSTTSSLPITLSIPSVPQKLEPIDIELPTSTTHSKPPYSYVALIRQAILSSTMQKMTLNEIYQWIVETYPYFRTAPPKWKNSIRHNLSLNKSFKRLQRGTNDPGKGSYWAIDESNEINHQSNARKRPFGTQKSLPTPSSPVNLNSTNFHGTNPIGYSDVSSIGGQSLSPDESNSTMSFAADSALVNWDDPNLDLNSSIRRFTDPLLETSLSTWMSNPDNSSAHTNNSSPWTPDLFPHGETNGFFENVKIPSSNGIDWSDIDVKPYCEFLGSFRANPTFQQQDRDKLLNLPTSFSSFFDYSNMSQNKITNDSMTGNRLSMGSNGTLLETNNNITTLPIVIEDEAFDWDSIA